LNSVYEKIFVGRSLPLKRISVTLTKLVLSNYTQRITKLFSR
jgi:hypothetical protein